MRKIPELDDFLPGGRFYDDLKGENVATPTNEEYKRVAESEETQEKIRGILENYATAWQEADRLFIS